VRTATKLRLVTLRAGGSLPDAIIEWVWSGESVKTIFETVRDAVPAFDEAAQADLMVRVEELSRTVAALTGLDLMSEVMDVLREDGSVAKEDGEPPDLDSMYGGDEPSSLDGIASANTQSAYARGKQDEDEGTDSWWEYVTQPGACAICEPLDGAQAPQDDGIWTDRIPPLHPNCSCDLKTIPAQKIRVTDHDLPDEARGSKGWGNPQKMFAPDLSDKPAVLLPLYEEKLRNTRRNN
jgi:hypothetical protein